MSLNEGLRPEVVEIEQIRNLLSVVHLDAAIEKFGVVVQAGFHVSKLWGAGKGDRFMVEYKAVYVSPMSKQEKLAAERIENEAIARYQEVLLAAGLEVTRMMGRVLESKTYLVVKP